MNPNREHGIKLSYMDRSADPGTDFFRYANGAWLDSTEIPPEYPRWGAFLMLRDQALETVHRILQDAAANAEAPAESNERKIGDFYFTGMDEDKIEADGARPLAAELKRIKAVRTPGQLADVVARLHLAGPNVFFGFGSGQDYKDTTRVIARASQSGLGLPDRDYYTRTDEKSVALRKAYVEHIQRMLELAGDSPRMATKGARAAMAIETRLAEASMTKVELRDPDATYNLMPISGMAELLPAFKLARYLSRIGCSKVAEVNVGQPAFFKALNTLLATTPMSELKAYLRWQLVNSAAEYLSADFVNADFEFFAQKLQGSKQLQQRWKRVVGVVGGLMGEAVGEIYVRDNFPPEAKARMLDLVTNLRAALKETLSGLDWMSESTRQSAIGKLEAFVAKIGYPDAWRDYSSLKVDRKSYLGNVMRAREFASRRHLAKIGKPVDRNEWHMTPQTVNAYYSPLMNEIVFPAAILQPPFFDLLADDATNYGGIGVVIGHEMTHGFDDKGSKFDAEGNLRNWWTDEDRANFERRIALIREQYGNFEVAGGVKLQGALVSGEAAADLGGLKLAYLALQKALQGKPRTVDAKGFTDEQRFFLSFAQIWASKATPEYQQLQATTDPHPPGKFRTNGTLANMPEFARAFGLPDDCPMMLPADKRCQLW